MVSTSKTSRRVLGIATAAALALGMAACSSTSTTAGSGGAKSGDSFTYWSMWNKTEPQAKVLQSAITAFTAQTGIKVDVTWAGRTVTKQIGPAVAAGDPPDLWDQNAGTVLSTLGSEGQALDLTPVLGMTVPGENVKVGSVIPAKYLTSQPKDSDGTSNYVIPYEVTAEGIFYNAADPNIKAAMPTPPTSWAQFISVCAALKSKSEPCIASEGEDSWTNGLYLDYELLANGVNWSALAADRTGAAWDAPGVATAVNDMDQLVSGGYIVPTYTATKYPAQETNWANGRAGFYMDGSYVTAEVSKEIPATWRTGMILPPGVTQADAGTFGFSIPKKAKNISAAEQFIAFFMQKSQLAGISTVADNITSRPDIAAPPELAAVQQALSAPTLRVDFSNTIPSDYYNKVYNQNFLDFWHGKLTAAQFIAKMKSDQIAYWQTQG
ncbi:ABC transporter substrate-binding protein [Streptacidiphilus sp. MAP5-3]|uniref:ABC transporter substrate-binding protein n=1 Tax=unclassified Streptacidiphilus TaxID=2643834 RepID=UPI0035161BED